MAKLVAQKFAGQAVWIGSGLVAFNEQGVAVGNVRMLDGTGNPVDNVVPTPLTDEQYAIALHLKGFRVIGWNPQEASEEGLLADEDTKDEASETAAELDGATQESPVMPEEVPTEGIPTAEPINASATAAARLAPPKPDFESMTRVELYQYLRRRGLEVGFLPREELLGLAKQRA